ncbi:phage terminase large subunit [Erythrobacteraceae bacterium WH01K]|nr:phage terminase large subunit [Erythrobacteraceae bacterium WH01K]
MAVPKIELNSDQEEAFKLATNAKNAYLLFYGPSRSGKSFLILYLIISRAMRAPESRHICFRGARNACEASLFKLTLRQVMSSCFPGLIDQCEVRLSDMQLVLPNKSVIMFDGLDADRLDKVLGQEYNTVWINECNDPEITYETVSQLMTRMSSVTKTLDGSTLANKMFFDCNPKWYSDWEYKAFILGVNPSDGNAMPDAHEWVSCKLNTKANLANISKDYMKRLAAGSAASRKRFIEGEWSSDNSDALFNVDWINEHRIPKPLSVITPLDTLSLLADQGINLSRITVAVDPAKTNDKKSDLHGLTVQGLAHDHEGNAHVYVLADYSKKCSTDAICIAMVEAMNAWSADRIVFEDNATGGWLTSTLRQYTHHIPKNLNANSRTGGKSTRAEPVSAQYERGFVHHVGAFDELEAQMLDWGSPASRKKSPDRMDAVVWGITELLDLQHEKKVLPGAHVVRSGYRL